MRPETTGLTLGFCCGSQQGHDGSDLASTLCDAIMPSRGGHPGNLTVVNKTRATPSWSDVKSKLTEFDRAGLVGLLRDLHDVSRDNQAFLYAQLGLGDDPLAAYKRTISRWTYPDLLRGQDVSVAKAKKAISEYKKAIGLPGGIAELSVFYCECAGRFLADCGTEDEGYFAALVRMFERALASTMALAPDEQKVMLDRLDVVRSMSDVGWGVADSMGDLWAEHVLAG